MRNLLVFSSFCLFVFGAGCSECAKQLAPVRDDAAATSAEAAATDDEPLGLPKVPRVTPPVVAEPAPGAACPEGMIFLGSYCIDRYEAPNEAGQYPLVMESGISAEHWCGARGKRLCTEDEWEFACAGAEGRAYPYGNTYEAARCSDEKVWIDKDEPTINQWPEKPAMGEVTRLYQAAKSGSYARCVTPAGVYDLTGNVEEWVVANERRHYAYAHVLKGCYWSGCYGGSKPTCKSTNAAHADTFKFYETGFRCCRDAVAR